MNLVKLDFSCFQVSLFNSQFSNQFFKIMVLINIP